MTAQKKFILGSALALLLLAGCGAQSAAPASSASGAASATSSSSASSGAVAAPASKGAFSVAITFDYKRMDTAASNQIAAWVEDKDGNVVRDLGATRFTATGGFARRKEALPLWVAKVQPDGTYTVWLEGTLYWTSDYRAHATVTVPAQDGALDVTETFTEDTAQNRDMITNVQMTLQQKN